MKMEAFKQCFMMRNFCVSRKSGGTGGIKQMSSFNEYWQYNESLAKKKFEFLVWHNVPKNLKIVYYIKNHNWRLQPMKDYKPTFGEYKEFDEESEEYIFDRLEEWAKSVIYMHHKKDKYLYINSFCWIDSNDTHYLTAFFRSNDILEKLGEIEEVKLSYILPNRSNRP